MSGERRERILGLLVDGKGGPFGTKRLCQVCAEVTEMTGAGIMLMAGDVAQGSLCTSNAMSDLIEQLQYSLGEGPCVDAYSQNWPVLEPDLAHPETPRWLAFAPEAIAGGVRAVFGFPLQVGSVRLGALNLCRDQAGPLSDDHHADALVVAGHRRPGRPRHAGQRAARASSPPKWEPAPISTTSCTKPPGWSPPSSG